MAERKGMYASTAWMLAAIVIFYALILVANQAIRHTDLVKQSQADAKFTSAQLKDKEAVFQKNLQERPALAGTLMMALFLILGTGLAIDGMLLYRSSRGQPWISGGVLQGPAFWGLRDVFHALVFLFFAEACVLIVELFLHIFWEGGPVNQDVILMLNSVIRDVLAAVMVVYIVRAKFGQQLADIGLSSHEWLANVRRGLVAYLAVIPVILLALFILSAILDMIGFEPPPQNVVQIYLKSSTEPYLIVFTFFVAALGPVIEEMFFRGFAYKAFRTRFGVGWAYVLSAAFFAAFHMNLVTFVPIFLLGMFLAYLYEETGSLVAPITAHVTHNFIMVCLTLGFKALSV